MSESKYQSIWRTYLCRNMHEATLAPPLDVTIPVPNEPRPVPQFTLDASPDSNWMVRRVGVFSNFADGLVFKNPADRLSVDMFYGGYQNNGETFELNLTYGSKTVTTTSGNPGWIPGTTYLVAVTDFATVREVLVAISATGANTGNLTDYWQYRSDAFYVSQNLSLVLGSEQHQVKNISTLNCMYEVNDFAQPSRFAGGLDINQVGISVAINLIDNHTTDFLTKTIDSAFTDDTAYFDVVLEVEFTGQ